MKDYKRLTAKIDGTVVPNCQNCQKFYEKEDCRCSLVLTERLAELEDKIEQGLLIELPCKVGDTLYEAVQGLPIYEWEVRDVYRRGIDLDTWAITAVRKSDRALWKFWGEDIGKRLFKTKEEAEAKLAELRGGR